MSYRANLLQFMRKYKSFSILSFMCLRPFPHRRNLTQLLNFFTDDDSAGLHHANVRQSWPPGRGFAFILLQQLLYRVGILLFLRLWWLILHRHVVHCHRRAWAVFYLDSVRCC